MGYTIQIEEVGSQSALVVAGDVPVQSVGEAIEASIGKVAAHLSNLGATPKGAPFTRTLSFENGRIVFEAGMPAEAAGSSDVRAVNLPGGTVATTVHEGPQDTSEKAYEAIHTWMAAAGKHAAGAPWEVYLDDKTMKVFFPLA